MYVPKSGHILYANKSGTAEVELSSLAKWQERELFYLLLYYYHRKAQYYETGIFNSRLS